jgi:predicted nuclease of restriction endonuclease-like RecB superfamily
MAFRMQDVPKTVRREKGSDRRRLYPRLLRADKIVPQLAIGIRYFETKLGMLRRELDADALLQLFGDPKLARCLVHCLARSYRYRTRTFADLFGPERAAALAERGIELPRDLRAWAYARANETSGFVAPTDRAHFLADLIPELDLVEAEQALWLDAPDQAILTRVGPVPTTEEVLASYHLHLLDSLLRGARSITLTLRGDQGLVEAVCARHGVTVECAGTTATFQGKQDAIGSWVRHGVRVARAVLALLACGALGPGEAIVPSGDEDCVVTLDAPTLRALQPQHGWSAPATTWEQAESFLNNVITERKAGAFGGWRLRRWPEPLIAERGAIWPEFSLSRGNIAIGLLPLTATQVRANAPALQGLADRLPFIVLVQGKLREVPEGLTILRLDGEGAALALSDYLARTFPLDAAEATPAWLAALADATRANGSLAESDLARRLDCAEELVAARLGALTEQTDDLTYIDGFGLCAADFLTRSQALLDGETALNAGRFDLGIVGRKLRTMIGRNEGLHALIAHLSGELQAAA